MIMLGSAAVVLAAAVAATSCRVHSRASSDVPVGADYRVRAYQVRTPTQIAGETMRMGSHGSGAGPGEYETWLVQGERRVARPLLRVVRVRDARALEYEVPRYAHVFWEEAGVVRLIERDPAGTVTFLHEVRLEPELLSGG